MPSVRYLTSGQVLYIHDQLIEATGGSHGVRDVGGLAAALARPQAGIADQELYPSLFEKAAALVHSIIGNHPFIDGNKRAGMAVAALFLEENGWYLGATPDDLEECAVYFATDRPNVDEIADWIRGNSRRLS